MGVALHKTTGKMDDTTKMRGAGARKAGVDKTSVEKAGAGRNDSAPHDASSAPVFENPLVPHAVLREMYRKMVETRLLGERAVKLAQNKKLARALKATYGQEACRVSLTQGLGAGDLVMDAAPGELTAHLLGSDAKDVLAALRSLTGTKGNTTAASKQVLPTRLLPFVEDTATRLFAGLGVALLARQMQRSDGVVIVVSGDAVSRTVWRRVLALAAKQQLPVIFLVLAQHGKAKTQKGISRIAERCGVPGIPVDANDAVALYRVAQESLGRIRAGGGAVLIEGVHLPDATEKKYRESDPVVQLKGYLVQRRVAPEEWYAEQEKSFLKQLGPMRRSIRSAAIKP